MKTVTLGNYEVTIDNTDVDFLKRFEAAAEFYNENATKIKVDGKASEMMEQTFELFKNTFDLIFGEGTTEKMFGKQKSVNEAIKAYRTIVDTVNDYDDVIDLTNINTNRAQRRATKKK